MKQEFDQMDQEFMGRYKRNIEHLEKSRRKQMFFFKITLACIALIGAAMIAVICNLYQ